MGSVKSIHGKTFPKLPRQKRRLRGRHFCVAFLVVLAVIFLQSIFFSRNDQSPSLPKLFLDYPDFFALRSEYLDQFSVKRHSVQKGDTLHQIFQDFDLPPEYMILWQKSCLAFSQISELQPGSLLDIQWNKENQQPVKFVFSSVDGSTYTFHRLKAAWECREDIRQPTKLVDTAAGSITDNLLDAFLRAGLTPELVAELADLFAYDIDFNTDLHAGDSFAVYFEQQVNNGKKIRVGPILAAQMTVSGELYQAFFHQLPDGYAGYFDAKGMSLKKPFLRTPLSYSRMTSTFSSKPFQPILRTSRPRRDIDYAAPAGAPVSALGDGVVEMVAHKGGLGRYVEVRHSGSFRTTYGHLSGFSKGLHAGSEVARGDVIGYVGSSGAVTGSHLNFRLYRKGKPLDFLQTRFPHERSIPKSLMSDFEKKRELYLAALREKLSAPQENPVKTTPDE